MAQIKLYGIKEIMHPRRIRISEVLHSCVVDAFKYPADKKIHRFIYLERDSFFYPPGRTENYIIIEVSIFEGRTLEAKKRLLQLIFERFERELEISPIDVEITIFETPMSNWGIRGKSADELILDYKVNI